MAQEYPFKVKGGWQPPERRTMDGVRPLQLWAAEADKITESRKLAAGVKFADYEVYAVNAEGEAIKFDPAATDGHANKAHGFTCIRTTEGSQWVQGYVAGAPNHEVLVWPDSLNTFEKRRAVFYDSRGMFVSQLNASALDVND